MNARAEHDDPGECDIDIDIAGHVESGAPPELVWNTIWDLARYGEWNRECVEAHWLPSSSEPAVGARFSGLNEWSGHTWTVVCEIIECTPPTSVRWTVGDPAHPSSTWSYTIAATEAGCTVSERFVHGPGNSGIRNMIRADPGNAATVITARSQMLHDNIEAGLRAIVEIAEAAASRGGDPW